MPLTFGAEILNEGAFAQVSCIVGEGDEPLTISWSFHGSHITTDLGIVTSQVGNRMSMLIISSVGHKHSGNYTCIAQNTAGTVSQTVELKVNGNIFRITKALEIILTMCFLLFLEPPDLLPLTFGRNVMNEGSFAQTSCIVSEGDEPLTISWSFHGNDIKSDLGISITPIGTRGSMLIISSVGHRHSGNYTCNAMNLAGSKAQTAELKVNGN
jgi:hypothetical protein